MERRTILKLVAAGVLPSSSGLVQLACRQDAYRPEFFSNFQIELLDSLTELILPSDDRSPGAKVARVARYIDVIISDGSPRAQESWRSGLDAIEELARSRFQCSFVECEPAQQDEIVADLSRNEGSPGSEAERFFILAKRATIDGYYTSEIGIHEDLGYQGNTALDEFPGCSHEQHAEASESR